jgi:hypothetical protein
VSGIWELPFARGGTSVASRMLGGWQVAGVYAYQTGFPIGNFPNVFFSGSLDDLALSDPTVARWFNTDAGFNRIAAQQPTTYDLRTFPLRVDELRGDPINNIDLSVIKNTEIVNGKILQLRLEALNAFNHPLLAPPPAGNLNPTVSGFGQISGQNNYARRVQAMVKFLF